MKVAFDESIEGRDEAELEDQVEQLQIKNRLEARIKDIERMSIMRQQQEVSMSIDLERLEGLRTSQADINAKRIELDDLRKKHQND